MAPRSSRNAGAPGAAVRAAAAGVVARVLRERVEADDALAAAEHGVAQRDRALLGALVYGTLRWHQRLEWQTARLLWKPLKPGQLELGQRLLDRVKQMGSRSQVTNTWTPGDPDLRFGLYGPGR